MVVSPVHQRRRGMTGTSPAAMIRFASSKVAARPFGIFESRFEAGDPGGQVTAAWLVAQDLMAAHAHPDRATGRAPAERSSLPPRPGRAPAGARDRPPREHSGRVAPRVPGPLRPCRRLQRTHRETSTSKSRTPNAPPGDSAACSTTACDYCSTTTSSVMIKSPHGPDPHTQNGDLEPDFGGGPYEF